jgi:predicted ATPase
MRLSAVTIQHFKSLANVTLPDLHPINVFVGQNAVGKSNFVDALKFLRDMVVEGLDHALSKRGGITVVRQHSRTKPYKFTIGIQFLDGGFDDGREREATYEITISSLIAGNYKIERERASWHEVNYVFDEKANDWIPTKPLAVTMLRGSDGEVAIGESKLKLPLDQPALGARLASEPGLIAHPIANFVSRFRFSTIFPNTLREPSRPDTDRALKESGENWASILKALKRTATGRAALERILEMMQIVMPTLRDVTVKSAGGYLVPQFKIRDRNRSDAHDFDPVQLSDGTLRIFGILLALYHSPAPALIALEEPEQTVHPGVLAMLADAFREVSERTQLFITSHSPHLIDYFKPDEIRVVTMDHGETRISRIKSSQLESVKERLVTLEELMTAEGLQPEEA